MTPDEVRRILQEKNVPFEEKPIQDGTQFRCRNGEIFSVYKTGALVCGGKITDLSKLIDEKQGQGDKAAAIVHHAPEEAIFVVYGHDKQARDDLELLLRRMGLNPIIFANLPAEGETIIEKLEAYIGHGGKAGYAFVLVTPDDEGRKVGDVGPLKYRARQNVVLELGMVLAKLGRKRVAVLRKQTVEQPSDIDGLLYIPFAERVEEIKLDIIKELQAAGFKPRL